MAGERVCPAGCSKMPHRAVVAVTGTSPPQRIASLSDRDPRTYNPARATGRIPWHELVRV